MADARACVRKNPVKLVVVTAAAAAILLSSWPYMWEGEFLSKWSAVATILSVIGAPVVYFIKTGERKRVGRNIQK